MGVSDFATMTGALQNRIMITENTTWRSPVGITQIKVSACAAGGAPHAGEFTIGEVHRVKENSEINIVVGWGNTIVGDFLTLIAAAITYNCENSILGYKTGLSGGDCGRCQGKGTPGYGGAFGFGGGAGGGGWYPGNSGMYGNGGVGGGVGGVGGSNAKLGQLVTTGGVGGSGGGTGGRGSLLGGGGGGNCDYDSNGGGGGAGGYGAGGGTGGTYANGSISGAPGQGAPGMVLIEW